MSATKNKRNIELYKGVDFRRELTFREKKVAEIKREKMKILADVKPVPKYMITVDLSHARGNLDALRMCLSELEWKQYPFGRKDQHCDIHWQCQNFEQNPDLYGGKVNKFPGISCICSKNNLFRVLDQMRALYPDDYDFYPRTWYLPEQLQQLAHDIRKMNEKRVKPRPTFIVKPDTGSQGEGIYLIRDVQDYLVNNGRANVCQEYLSDVFLIDKFKFDLRVYAVLKSVDPLELYICKEGLARFSTVPYESPTSRNIHETFMHLTNYSLNKKSTSFNRSDRDDEGSKRTLTSVFSRMQRHGYNTDKIWKRIEHIIVKTMIAIIPDMKIEMLAALPPNKPGPTCFQILGFDILLLHNLKPILLEINSSPSLRIDSEVEVAPGVVDYVPSPKDEEVKIPLIRDTLLLVAPKKKVNYLESFREVVHGETCKSFASERQKRRRARRERRRQKRDEDDRKRKEEEASRPPVQHERDGVIHVETQHPRSSIVIIKSQEDDDPPKKLNRESSFLLPSVHNVFTNRNENDYFNKDQNQNSLKNDEMDSLTFGYGERTDFIDRIEDDENVTVERLTRENLIDHENSHTKEMYSKSNIGNKTSTGNQYDQDIDNTGNEINNDMRYSDNKDSDYMIGQGDGCHNDRGTEESSNSEEEIDSEPYVSCLKELYPDPLAKKFEHLRIYEKLAEVFMVSLGVRATQRLGPTGFRTFSRKCRLNKKGITNATIDILFIDMQRKWEHVNPERTTGLGFRGFLDACHEIARRKFANGNMLQTMEDFIDYCLDNLHEDQLFQARCNPRLLPRRARPHGYPILEPMVSPTSPMILEENIGVLLESRLAGRNYSKPTSAEDVDQFLRRHGQLRALKTTVKRVKSRNKKKEKDE
ncbi:tubulin polyglutamylase TTLL11-like isoform X2 [Ruditapes philippinarum]|uniref:tubulin polyglutamylase TTLL11-like isoform X2 n=1 Tax=Ruditapes philippinarum TaxID=129788 RepID=UPI00295BBED1|nr:tubulin polyglutamylase TTLL11-like isoform X2 [Ruditapes philippinarum]